MFFMQKMTLITMGAGNVQVLKKTFQSLSPFCDEIVYGDLLIFPEDRKVVEGYKKDFDIRMIHFPFNYIFHNGFASTLNQLAAVAKNDIVVYMNTSEVIEQNFKLPDVLTDRYNCWYFDHATDRHHWYRIYNRHEMEWSGMIHEELVPKEGFDHRPYHKPVFRMMDLEKDMDHALKARVFNDVKEIVYFTNYGKLVDSPELRGATNPGWWKFATDEYESMQFRLRQKGTRLTAFQEGSYGMYWNAIHSDPEFEIEVFASNQGIEFQGDPKFLGKDEQNNSDQTVQARDTGE
ncbi:MAG: hypothetical protein C5B59_08005 [Bacteroidetes bacterium]|nr:MAG: hypothetical protein C5B59_08005 [Bacteroidota bacterium]